MLPFVSCILTVAVTETLKKRFGRARPHPRDISQRRFNLRGMLTNHAFPSGDSAQVCKRIRCRRLTILVEQSAVAGLVLAHYCQVLCWFFVVPLTMFRYVSATALFVLLI